MLVVVDRPAAAEPQAPTYILTTVPEGPERSSTQSHSWCTSQSPRPRRWAAVGSRCPALGSLMCPESDTSQTSPAAPRHSRTFARPPPCCSEFVATSLVAVTSASTSSRGSGVERAASRTRARSSCSCPGAETWNAVTGPTGSRSCALAPFSAIYLHRYPAPEKRSPLQTSRSARTEAQALRK
jgi:hypothetical protein